MTAEQAAAQVERFAQDLPQALERGMEEALKQAKERAIWWSSGPLSTAQLRKMGHPYARRAPAEGVDAGRINIQSQGKKDAVALVDSWQIAPVKTDGGKVTGIVYNAAPHARFLYDERESPKYADRGTRLMIGRPLPERVLADLERGMALAPLELAIERKAAPGG